ncbi:DinB superfamily protein [Arenibacter nanhaiticus]|uniref:DinB superfamily protein n=1 Tax=Arenibacter nanhaiticus TaxID=558155 RepID=A0A1M6B8D8_9FLAO|nr:DinB family protein [Arenibacter nanhaiticus]SHI44996.1 DinB superfamily protein [Arenibacter nanhaiticus]
MTKKPTSQPPEFWLRGSIDGIPTLLQPAAHALLQSREELGKYTTDFPNKLLWEKPAGCASVGFHIQHITGVVDRMLSYAQEKSLSEQQFQYLRQEGDPNPKITIADLVSNFDQKVEEALLFFGQLPESELILPRTVGRKKLPSTVLGLLFHAAEHSQRHIGQLLVTVRVFQSI